MQSTRAAAPKKTEEITTHRDKAMDLLVFQITRNPDQVDAARLKRHVFGILRPTMQSRLKNFLENPENKSFELTVSSWDDLLKLNSLLEKSGLFKSVDLIYEEQNADGSYDATLDVVPKTLTLGAAKKLLSPKEKKLFALMKKEAAPKAVSEFKKPTKAKLGTDPLGDFDIESGTTEEGGIEDLSTDTLFGEGGSAKTAPKKVEEEAEVVVAMLPVTIRDSDGDKVPLIPNRKQRKKIQEAIDSGEEIVFKVRGSSRAKVFADEKFLEKHGIDPARVHLEQTGKREWQVTLNGELSEDEELKRRYESMFKL